MNDTPEKTEQETSAQERKPAKNRPIWNPSRWIFARTWVLAILGFAAFVLLGVVLYKTMIADPRDPDGVPLRDRAASQQTGTTTDKASRGRILDADGNVLAMNETRYNVILSPKELDNNCKNKPENYAPTAQKIADFLAEFFDVSAADVTAKYDGDRELMYYPLLKGITADLGDLVEAFRKENKLGYALYLEAVSVRYYPYNDLACQVVGFVGSEGSGLYGVESLYNDYLTGTDGRVTRVATGETTGVAATDGGDVTLTIRLELQNLVQEKLWAAVEKYDIQQGGCAIVMDVKTGAILALANVYHYDLNDYLTVTDQRTLAAIEALPEEEQGAALGLARVEQWGDYAVTHSYEPGSVFKPITMSMALEEGTVALSDTFLCEGSIEVLGRTSPLYCSHRHGHGILTLKQAMEESCNVAFAEIALELGADLFYQYVDLFGLFDKTHVDLDGEGRSLWWSDSVFKNPRNHSQLAVASFGQTFTVTPIQMITAFTATVNGGYLLEPYVVSEIKDAEGNLLYNHDRTVVRQVVSEETSRIIRDMLEAVVTSGTGKAAYIPGYHIGGKTGTSEKIGTEDEFGNEDYIASFCAVAPCDEPEVVVLVVLDTPNKEINNSVSGGTLAAPVCGEIISAVLDYLGFQPDAE